MFAEEDGPVLAAVLQGVGGMGDIWKKKQDGLWED